MHGFGVYKFGNGHRYEGAWHEGRRQGFGTYTFRNGETQSGHWQNGVLNVSSAPGTRTGSSATDDHSKVLNAVQEAIRAAEKANDVVKVDERVKRAVATANKAATAARE
nr:phosphatidylinositol 4-phosphate 5-kinase 4-like [Ipomoea batatas]